jgi:hypothetical protein
MTLPEWFCEWHHKSPRDKGSDYAGKLTRHDLDELKDWMNNGPA